MKRKLIKTLMGLALSAVILTTGLTGVYAEGTETTEATPEDAISSAFEETDTTDGDETGTTNTPADDEGQADDSATDTVTPDSDEQTTEASTEASTEVKENTNKPYLSLGENLKDDEKKEVLKLLGIDAEKLDEYTVLTVSNDEEHHYLDSYVEKSKIGSRALSSVVIREADKGAGLSFSIYNIDYCTVGMYKNVCTTLGIKDADITIAGPFKLSGTAAIIGIVKAYEAMTGEKVSEDIIDAAMNEIVVTGELENSIDGDPEEVEAFMADLKAQVKNLETEEEIKEAIKTTAEKYNLSLSETDINNIYYLLDKLKDLDLDWDFIEEQANDLISLWNEGDMDSFWDKFLAFFAELLKSLTGLFS